MTVQSLTYFLFVPAVWLLWRLIHGRTGREPAWLTNLAGWSVTFSLMSLGWILFRADNLHQAMRMLSVVFQPVTYRHLSLRPNYYLVTMIIILGYFAVCGYDWLVEKWGQSPLLKRTSWLAFADGLLAFDSCSHHLEQTEVRFRVYAVLKKRNYASGS